jgi:hypothetical protein
MAIEAGLEPATHDRVGARLRKAGEPAGRPNDILRDGNRLQHMNAMGFANALNASYVLFEVRFAVTAATCCVGEVLAASVARSRAFLAVANPVANFFTAS